MKVCKVCRCLNDQDNNGKVPCILVHLAPAALTLLLQFLEEGEDYTEQLDNDGGGDVGHDPQGKYGGL